MTLLQFEIALCIGLPVAAFAVTIALHLAEVRRYRNYWKDQASKESK